MRIRLLVLFASILLTLAAVEVALRAFDVWEGRSFWRTTGNVFQQPLNPIVPFRIFGFDPYRQNGAERLIASVWGETFPYRKPAGTYRIVTFGGSTTEGAVEGLHYPLALQRLLRDRLQRDDIEVINVGNSAYATPHAIILLELDVLSWSPDLVIISHNINDLDAMYFPDFRPDYWHKFSNRFFSLPDYASRYTLANLLFQYSRLYWFVRKRLTAIERRWTLPPPVRRRSYGDEPLPEAAAVFRRNLQTFVTIARSRDIDVLIGGQPLEASEDYFLRHMADKSYNDIVVYPLHHEFVKHHAAFNRIAEEVAGSAAVGYVDNPSRFGGKSRYFIDFVHYTKEGIITLAESYADFIIAHGLIPGQGSRRHGALGNH